MTTKNLRVETRQPQPVACMRANTPDVGSVLPRLLPATLAWVNEHGGQVAGAPVVRYLQVGSGTFEIEAGYPTAAPMTSSGDIVAFELPGGNIAVAEHHGLYNTLGESAAALFEYVRSQGRNVAGPYWESYVTNPTNTSDLTELMTEVCVPVA
jgi:effector-binding domain-containing protein